MLILTRKIGEAIQIGKDIRIIISDAEGGTVKVGIEAPRSIPVHREEIYRKIHDQNLEAARTGHHANLEALAAFLQNKNES
jgi:carbon storage regulator